MNIKYYVEANYQEVSKICAKLILDVLKEKPNGLYCFAGGDTPVGTLNIIAEAAINKEIDLSQAKFIELDEWVGIDPKNEGSCLSYLKRNLFNRVPIDLKQLHTFDPLADDLNEECKKADKFIEENGGLTLSLLGVGENGHLGFNEPGSSFEDKAHIVNLDESTQSVGKKYFSDEKVDRTKGITLGIGQLLQSGTMIVQASGAKKKSAIQQFLSGTITKECPVTSLWLHKDPVLVVDKEVVN